MSVLGFHGGLNEECVHLKHFAPNAKSLVTHSVQWCLISLIQRFT